MKNNTFLILILISAGLFYTFINPEYKEVRRLTTLASDYNNVLDSVASIAETRNRLQAEYQSIPQAEIERLSKAVPDHIDNVRFALDLDSMASKHGISIKDIQTLKSTDPNASVIQLPDGGKTYDKAGVSFSFISTHEQFLSFLADIEKSLRVMDVNLTSFQVGETPLYEFQMSVETYWLK